MELINDQKQPERLIVLITDSMVTNSDLAHKIHWIAYRENLTILYLVLVNDNENMVTVSREMATMKAVTSANRLAVEAKLTDTGAWFETLCEIAGPGDIIICQEEQTMVNGLFKTMPVSEFLSNQLKSPIRIISGYYHPIRMPNKKRYQEVLALFGFLVILAVFTWGQIWLDQALDGWAAKLIIAVTFVIEMSAVWAWNEFTFR